MYLTPIEFTAEIVRANQVYYSKSVEAVTWMRRIQARLWKYELRGNY